MKVLHTADWHLGIDLHRLSLLEDQQYFMKQLKDIVVEENIDVIVIAGDVYDTTLAKKEAITIYNECMTMLCMELHKQVILIAGNHDSSTRLSTCADLLAPMGLHVIGKIEDKVKGICIDDVVFYPIPYFHPETIRLVYDCEVQDMNDAFRIICEDIQQQEHSHKCQIAIAHCYMNGATLCESDRFASVGGSDLISSTLFEDFDYVALGHLHRSQKVGKHAYYSGSPLGYSFSEANQKKQVMIFDSVSKEVTSREIQPLHPLLIKKGTFEELQKDILLETQGKDAYLKIEIEKAQISYEMLEYFREHYANVLQLSGKNEEIESKITMQVEDIESLDDESILKRFFQDMFGEEVSKENLELFKEAKKACEENDDVA